MCGTCSAVYRRAVVDRAIHGIIRLLALTRSGCAHTSLFYALLLLPFGIIYSAANAGTIGTKRRPYVKNTAQSSANGLASGGSEAPSEGSASWSVIPCSTPHTGHTRLRSVLNSLRDGRGCEAEQESRPTVPDRKAATHAMLKIVPLSSRCVAATRCPKGH